MKNIKGETLTLHDGRKLAYMEYGQADGYPILLFHGTPGSRFWFLDDDEQAKELGICLIALDRPGFGASDPKPDRTLLSWADDVAEAVRCWELEAYSVLGVSGGGPYAAACAYRRLRGLRSAAMVASVAPFVNGKPPKTMSRPNRIAFWLSRHAPWLLRGVFAGQIKLMDKQPDKFKQSLKTGNSHLPDWDRSFIQTDEQIEGMMLHLREAHRQGPDETVREQVLVSKPWGFALSDIQIPVYVFHGKEDTMAPFAAIQEAVAGAQNCRLVAVEKAGHFVSDDEEVWADILCRLKEGDQDKAIWGKMVSRQKRINEFIGTNCEELVNEVESEKVEI